MGQKNLRNLVTAWAKEEADAVGSVPAEVLRDLVEHHVAGALVFAKDIDKFFSEYSEDVANLVQDSWLTPENLEGWNDSDKFCLSSENRLLLAQWAFEQEAAFILNEITQQQEEKANEGYGMGM